LCEYVLLRRADNDTSRTFSQQIDPGDTAAVDLGWHPLCHGDNDVNYANWPVTRHHHKIVRHHMLPQCCCKRLLLATSKLARTWDGE
jgi:hypothetical protein